MGKGGCKGGNGVPALEFQPWDKERGSISTHPQAWQIKMSRSGASFPFTLEYELGSCITGVWI